MAICGIKQKKSDHDVFLSIVERNIYNGQIGTIIAVDASDKILGELIDVFEDGSIHFVEGNDSKKIGLKVDGDGRLFGISRDGKKITASKMPIEKSIKSTPEVTMFKSFPLTHVVDSACSGASKTGCKKPYTVALVYSTSSCPPKTVLMLKDYFNGSQVASLIDIGSTGTITIIGGVNSSYGLDITPNGSIKVRGKLPVAPVC